MSGHRPILVADALARLRAGLDADEAAARAAIIPEVPNRQREVSTWEVFDSWDDDEHSTPTTYVGQWGEVHLQETHGSVGEGVYDHIARQDPRTTLRRVAAIRRAIGEVEEIINYANPDDYPTFSTVVFQAREALEALADIYTEEK